MIVAAPIAAVWSMRSMQPTRSQHLHPHGGPVRHGSSSSSDGNSNSNSKRERKCMQRVPETPAASTPVFPQSVS